MRRERYEGADKELRPSVSESAVIKDGRRFSANAFVSELKEWVKSLETHYKTLVHYLHFKDCGSFLGYGCGSVGMTQSSEYPQLAYKLGKGLKS